MCKPYGETKTFSFSSFFFIQVDADFKTCVKVRPIISWVIILTTFYLFYILHSGEHDNLLTGARKIVKFE